MEVVLLPPTSLSNAVKEGGEVLDSWLNHQTILALPRQHPPPPDTRLPWNKSFAGMAEYNGPSMGRIIYIARPKRTVGMEVHTRSTKSMTTVPKAALKYNISPQMEQLAQPKKIHPPDVNEPWKLKSPGYKCPEYLEQLAKPRKTYPSTDRPLSSLGHPPRAALYGSPPTGGAREENPYNPLPPAPPSIHGGESPPEAAESATEPTGSSTSATGSTTEATGSTTEATSSSAAVTSSSTAATTSSTTDSPAADGDDAPADDAPADEAPPEDEAPAEEVAEEVEEEPADA